MSSFDSVGTLLAAIANLVADGLRILNFADKRQWGQDEHEQVRALEAVLDEAKKDFQDLSPLVNGQAHYEHDRRHESLEELRALGSKFYTHIQDLKGWIRTGGPINPIWTRETHALQKELHRTQCRAARRIYTSGQEATQRCLGAFLVRRKQRAWSTDQIGQLEGEYQRRYLDELVACNSVGLFERFGDQDIAFICDFCDGHVVWDDLEGVPSVRSAQENASSPISPVSPTTNNPYWQATGFARSSRQEKQVIFAPIAVANHIAPKHGDWQAKLVCPYCEELGEQPQEEDDEEETWRPDGEFDDVAALQEHLEWQHTAASALPTTIPIALPTATDKCQIM